MADQGADNAGLPDKPTSRPRVEAESSRQQLDVSKESSRQQLDVSKESSRQQLDVSKESRRQQLDVSKESRRQQLDVSKESSRQQLDVSKESRRQQLDVSKESRRQQLDVSKESSRQQLDVSKESRRQQLDVSKESSRQQLDVSKESSRQQLDVSKESSRQQLDVSKESSRQQLDVSKESSRQQLDVSKESSRQQLDVSKESRRQQLDVSKESSRQQLDVSKESRRQQLDVSKESRRQQLDVSKESSRQQLDVSKESRRQQLDVSKESSRQQLDVSKESSRQQLDVSKESSRQQLDVSKESSRQQLDVSKESSRQQLDVSKESSRQQLDVSKESRRQQLDVSKESRRQQLDVSKESSRQQLDVSKESSRQQLDVSKESSRQQLDVSKESSRQQLDVSKESRRQQLDVSKESSRQQLDVSKESSRQQLDVSKESRRQQLDVSKESSRQQLDVSKESRRQQLDVSKESSRQQLDVSKESSRQQLDVSKESSRQQLDVSKESSRQQLDVSKESRRQQLDVSKESSRQQLDVSKESRRQQLDNNAGEKAKQILTASSKGGFTLHPDSLESILLADDVINKPVVVISVAGAFRKGKSFLLDMMLRYLTASDKSNWVNERSTRGFPWQSGYKRHTTGILMWSQLFPVTLPTGEEAVIVLMDTQGTFDNQSTMHESSTVFALSTLLSSLQILNLVGNLQNDDLEHLQLFTEYGRMALDDTSTKPFQKLLFLVRDWWFIHELQLGAAGGDRLVTECLQNQSGKMELEKVRKHIRDCFSEINGFLLPHPGQQVASSPNFDGSSSDMDPAFVAGLKELMPKILAPENLTVKTIAGNPVKAQDLYKLFTSYVDLFQSDKLPQPKNIMQATAEANNMAAVLDAKSQYIKETECLGCDDQPSLDQERLFRKHREAATKAERVFDDRKKMGDRQTSDEYRRKLVQEMEELFKFSEQANNIKREKERLDAENHNMAMVVTCKAIYISDMDPVAGETVGYLPPKEFDSAHEVAKHKALDQFDAEKKVFGGAELEYRYKLSQEIEVKFRQMVYHNDIKKDVKNIKAALANMKAMVQAKKSYQSKMNASTVDGALTAEMWQSRHQQALQDAIEMFESLKEGDDLITVGYLEYLKNDIDCEMDTYITYIHTEEEKPKPEKSCMIQ